MPTLRLTHALAALFGLALSAPLVLLAGQGTESSKTEAPAIDLAAELESLAGKAKALVNERWPATPKPVYDGTDAADDRVRFVVLLRQGPLIVDANVTIEGKSFRQEREKMVDQLLAAADTDRDGKPTWEEAGKNLDFQAGSLAGSFILARRSPPRKAAWIKTYDENADGIVDRPEVRRFIHQHSGLPAFSATEGDNPDRFAQPDLSRLLDVDSSGFLSAEELADIPARLKRSDLNDDDVIDADEIEPRELNSVTFPVTLAVEAGNADLTYQHILYYATKEPERAAPLGVDRVLIKESPFAEASGRDQGPLSVKRYPLLKYLDKNGNGQWEAEEANALLKVSAHLALAVDLGKRGGQPPVLKVKPSPLDVGPRAHKEGTAWVLATHGARIELRVDPATDDPPREPKPEESAKFLLQHLDRDANGFVDKREVKAGFFRLPLHLYDQDGDGKAFLQEIQTHYQNDFMARRSQLHLSSISLGAGIFGAIDTSADGRLSPRELRQASARIAAFDQNRDGKVALSEIPATIALTFSTRFGKSYEPLRTPAALADVPAWFARMDRNRDGDLSPREFLGDAEAFRKLDADGDGLVSVEEGKAAKADVRPNSR